MVSVMDCWSCGKDIRGVSNLDCFFWCNQTCKANHAENEAKQKAKWDKDAEKAEKSWKPNGQKTKGEPVPDTRYDPKTGRKKRVKKDKTVKSATASIPGKKTCGKCGELGHNARTCNGKKEIVPANVVRKSHIVETKTVTINIQTTKGKYKCKICGEVGHNARRHA